MRSVRFRYRGTSLTKSPTKTKSAFDLSRAYADRLVLSGIAKVDSTLRLSELAAHLASHGINLAGLRALLATNPERFLYADRRWLPAPRVLAGRGPLQEQIRQTLLAYGGPMPIEDLAGELSKSRQFSKEYWEERLPSMVDSDPAIFSTPSGFVALYEWVFVAETEDEEVALFKNKMTTEDIAPWRSTLGRIDYSDEVRAAKSVLKHAPVPVKVVGFFAWRQLNPRDPYAPLLYNAETIFDALITEPDYIFGPDGTLYPESEAQKWVRQALREAEKLAPAFEVEEAAPLEFGDREVDEITQLILSAPTSISIGEILERKYELTPQDRTYPEDLANAMTALEASGKVWYVGGDRFRKPDSAPALIYSVPELFHFVEYDFRDSDGEPIDVDLSDDAFSSALRKEMSHPLAQDVLDEDPQPKPKKLPESLNLVLKSLHREIGTFPLCQFPTGWFESEPAIQELIFVGPGGQELSVWLNQDIRLMFNLIDWWFEQPVESGAIFSLTKTNRPNIFEFAWLDENDPLVYISNERIEQLRDLASRAQELSTYEILIEVLSHYPKGTDYVTLLAEMNVVRRVSRRLVASLLTGYHCFFQRAGSPVWHFDAKKVDQGFDKAKRKFIRK